MKDPYLLILEAAVKDAPKKLGIFEFQENEPSIGCCSLSYSAYRTVLWGKRSREKANGHTTNCGTLHCEGHKITCQVYWVTALSVFPRDRSKPVVIDLNDPKALKLLRAWLCRKDVQK